LPELTRLARSQMEGPGALSVVAKAWAELDLEALRPKLDETGLKVAEQQEAALANRKKLADATREFKKSLADAPAVKGLSQLLKMVRLGPTSCHVSSTCDSMCKLGDGVVPCRSFSAAEMLCGGRGACSRPCQGVQSHASAVTRSAVPLSLLTMDPCSDKHIRVSHRAHVYPRGQVPYSYSFLKSQ
jgi:hypothetical protein